MAIAASNSVCNRFNMKDTASSPPTPRAKKIGFPIPTAEAPRATRKKEKKGKSKTHTSNKDTESRESAHQSRISAFISE